MGWATAPVPAMAQSARTKSDGAERPPEAMGYAPLEAIAFSRWQFPQLPLSAILVTALKIAYTENSVEIRQLN
ncbi:hypothetical protein [Cylindrospermum stagnale]|uniref:hypothetical protein n=1 Tax=Cylindrospermum stagnale TaxID=142864 RepID=UPI00059D045C|nr:hypothetical protein [Cylindrospermum stagnale]